MTKAEKEILFDLFMQTDRNAADMKVNDTLRENLKGGALSLYILIGKLGLWPEYYKYEVSHQGKEIGE